MYSFLNAYHKFSAHYDVLIVHIVARCKGTPSNRVDFEGKTTSFMCNEISSCLVSIVAKMYHTFRLNIQKGEEISYLQYLSRVHQGDPLTPLLFVLVYQVYIETLDVVRGHNLLPLPFCYFPNAVNGSPWNHLTHQRPTAGTPFAFLKSIYVDDEALLSATQ